MLGGTVKEPESRKRLPAVLPYRVVSHDPLISPGSGR
jgi:hypothetical protein